MPYTINGIGTRHWGKTNIHREMGTCEFCHRFGELRSCDTTLYFVVVYIPLIPLKKQRVLRACPHCQRFRVTSLSQWKKSKAADIDAAFKQLQTDSHNPAALKRALGTVVGYHDEPAFQRLASLISDSGEANPEVLATIGAGYTVFRHHAQSEHFFKASLAVHDDPGVREDLALCLMKQGRPAEAAPLIEHILTTKSADKIGLVSLLIESWQAAGCHQEALDLIARGREAFPAEAESGGFAGYEKNSRKHLQSGKAVKSAHLAEPRGRGLESDGWQSIVPRLLGPAVLLLIAVGYLAAAFAAGKSRDVWIVNGLDIPYSVTVQGTPVSLPPHGIRMISISEGAVPLTLSEGDIRPPDETCTVSTPFFKRPFLNKTFVINPDQAALIVWEQTVYAATAVDGTRPYRLHVGQTLYEFDGIEYPFDDFPDEVQISSNVSRVRKERIYLPASLSPGATATLVASELGAEPAARYVKSRLAIEPGDVQWLNLAAALLPPEETLGLLRSRLRERPLEIDAHRLYQALAERAEPEHDLAAEYRLYAEKELDDADLKYLLARVLPNPDEQTALFRAAAGAGSAYGWSALAFDDVSMARYGEALEAIDKALASHPENPTFLRVKLAALEGLERWGALLEQNRAFQQQSPHNYELKVEEARLLALQGDRAGADRVAESLAGDIKQRGEDNAQEWRAYMDASIAYAEGDQEQYARNMAILPDDHSRFQAAFASGDVAAAAQALERSGGATPHEHLLLYLAAQRAGQDDLAGREWKMALDALASGDEKERTAAAALKDPAAYPPDALLRHADLPAEKSVLLAVAGQRDPDRRQVYYDLARQLNHDRTFPHLFLKELLGTGNESARHSAGPGVD